MAKETTYNAHTSPGPGGIKDVVLRWVVVVVVGVGQNE